LGGGPQKIICIAKAAWIDEYVDWKRRALLKLSKNLERSVDRSVVSDQEFPGETRLARQAVELPAQESLTVKGGHSNGTCQV
jgi:hypothetical protein